MELDELKNTWDETKNMLQKHPNVQAEMLQKMKARKYKSNLKKIIIPEIAGSMVCLAAATFIVINYSHLNTSLLQSAAILSVLLLLLLPVLSFFSIWQLNKPVDLNKPYAETLSTFAGYKIRFVKLQKFNLLMCYLLLIAVIVLLSKFMSGKDLSGNKYFWLFSLSMGYIFLLFYSKWVKKYYSKALRQAEELLSELKA